MFTTGFLALCILAGVHLFANRPYILGWIWRSHFLSFASGVSLAYVLVDLLPILGKGQLVLERNFDEVLPYLELHVYLIALLGILFYYGVQSHVSWKKTAWLPMSGDLIYNFFIGATLSNTANPEIQPLTLFTIAIGLDYFIQDHLDKIPTNKLVLYLIIAALFAGYLIGYLLKIPDHILVIGISFIAGEIMLNTFQYELPKKDKGGYLWFVCGALLYAGIILSVAII